MFSLPLFQVDFQRRRLCLSGVFPLSDVDVASVGRAAAPALLEPQLAASGGAQGDALPWGRGLSRSPLSAPAPSIPTTASSPPQIVMVTAQEAVRCPEG